MSEHITLTELAELEQAAADAAPYVPSRDAIPRLAATLREALVLLGELTAGEKAGYGDEGSCYHCDHMEMGGVYHHADTCPIVRARTLLKGEGDDK